MGCCKARVENGERQEYSHGDIEQPASGADEAIGCIEVKIEMDPTSCAPADHACNMRELDSVWSGKGS